MNNKILSSGDHLIGMTDIYIVIPSLNGKDHISLMNRKNNETALIFYDDTELSQIEKSLNQKLILVTSEEIKKTQNWLEKINEIREKYFTTPVHTIDHEIDFKYNAPHHFTIKDTDGKLVQNISFQEGPIKEVGMNGVFDEDLLKIIKIRLEHFQKSEYKHHRNQECLDAINNALDSLSKRKEERLRRGVQGTNNK